MTPAIRPAAVTMLVASLAIVAPRAQQAPTFRAGTTAVRVDAWVGRSDRRVFTGLSATDFRVLDNGVAQDVTDLQYGKLPIDVTIALDTSHSVTGRVLAELRDAITELMHDLGPTDRLKLMFFDERVIRAVDFTGDATQVDAALQSATAGGGTSLFDAISVALLSSSARDRRQLVMFFTDAADGNSTTNPKELAAVIDRTTATLAIVVPAGPNVIFTSAAIRDRISGFTRLAARSGGQVITMTPTSNLATTFRSVLGDFRSEYVLYFTPRGVDSGGVHTLDVKVTRPGAIVRARSTYVGDAR
jgi:VWFA-related protein